MEVEQLLSWIRYERSRLTGFAALDEILTVVNEAKDRVEAAAKQVAEYETKLAGLKAVEDAANYDHAQRIAKAYEAVAQRKVEADLENDTLLTERKQAYAKLDADIATKQHALSEMALKSDTLAKQVMDLEGDKANLTLDIMTLRKQLQDIKDSIH